MTPALTPLFDGALSALRWSAGTAACFAPEAVPLLLPGSFNPLHDGHLGLAATAARLLGCPCVLELSIVNVDKPPLTPAEVEARLASFPAASPDLWLTRAPTFVAKARLFPGTVFVVGADTAERIIAPRYYDPLRGGLTAALEELRSRQCRFLVAARQLGSGDCQQLSDLSIPAAFADLFHGIAREEFFLPISSTELRQKRSASI